MNLPELMLRGWAPAALSIVTVGVLLADAKARARTAVHRGMNTPTTPVPNSAQLCDTIPAPPSTPRDLDWRSRLAELGTADTLPSDEATQDALRAMRDELVRGREQDWIEVEIDAMFTEES